MLFNSVNFMIFFPIVLLIYFVIPKKIRYIWLLISSYYFYMSWNPKYAILIAISTVVTYFCALLVESADTRMRKKFLVVLSLVINLGILFSFKYAQFAIDTLNMILGIIGVSSINHEFDIILPVGISFYTFQALGYTIDVFRGELKAERNIFKYALFVSFFPQLVAGPIERSKNLMGQIRNIEKINIFNYEKITSGAVLVLWGLFQKMVIADRAAILVDKVYGEYWIYGSIELILATVLFAVQIYCDFASYSTIAIGTARILGFDLMENFNTPYLAVSVKDFWRRWHISLSTWFRDYLYIPLGGSRCAKWRHYLNIMITFLVSGLWHGANWTYIIWGGLHGLYQIFESVFEPLRQRGNARNKIDTNVFSYKLGRMIITFAAVDFAWIFFRAKSVSDAVKIIQTIFTKWNFWVLSDQSLYDLGLNMTEIHILVVALLLMVLTDYIKYSRNVNIDTFVLSQTAWFRWCAIIFIFMFIMIYGIYGPNFDATAFIYFQF